MRGARRRGGVSRNDVERPLEFENRESVRVHLGTHVQQKNPTSRPVTARSGLVDHG
jgi:hypothetical protein